MKTSCKFYSFLRAVRGNWRNAIFVSCGCDACMYGREKPCSGFLLTVDECGQVMLLPAEIIKCVEQDVFSLPSERVLMEKVYGDSETTCQNIASLMKNSRSSQAVTLAVANLYLRQQIIFERIST